ncbi:MAG TPA: orotate phosphoribosyltransferase [Thermoanaerobaculia bacterium]|nr:orotate phosphoribosyltransferase [Thermoanaerobaculia bacterium]
MSNTTSLVAAPLLRELQAILERQSIRRGDFTLTSGAKSKYYCDTKATVLSPSGAALVGRALHALLAPHRPEAVGGLAMGAAYLATAVAIASVETDLPIPGFVVRAEAKGHGTLSRIDQAWHAGGPLITAGRKVAVVDDVVTTAGSTLRAIDAVVEAGCEVVAVAAVLDRQAGGAERIRDRGLPFAALFRADSEGELHLDATWS